MTNKRPWASGLGCSATFTEATSNDGKVAVDWPKAIEDAKRAKLALTMVRIIMGCSYSTTAGFCPGGKIPLPVVRRYGTQNGAAFRNFWLGPTLLKKRPPGSDCVTFLLMIRRPYAAWGRGLTACLMAGSFVCLATRNS